MKRYALVRVDNNCPYITEFVDHIKAEKVFDCDEFWQDKPCSKSCRYGDTKEQLISKIQKANTRFFCKKSPNVAVAEKQFLLEVIKEHGLLAKEIVEFLGVEDERKK